MTFDVEDTIAAIASAAGGAARGIVRVSGPRMLAILAACLNTPAAELQSLRAPRVIRSRLALEGSAAQLPVDVYLWPGARSYTRQPVAELHTLGSPPLLAAVLRRLCQAGARPAEPGEFTLRAFLAGRLDLTQAEAVLGVIDAAGQSELQAALAQLAGGLARPLHELRESLLNLLAELEAGLDFVEEDIEFISSAAVQAQLAAAGELVSALGAQMSSRCELEDVQRVVLVGAPNAGKSSLFNALVRGGRAIVSSEPGATRDYLTAWLELAGTRVKLIDTAGVDHAPPSGDIAQAAQHFRREQSNRADLRLVCVDTTLPVDGQALGQRPEMETDSAAESADSPRAGSRASSQIVVLTKSDAASQEALARELPADAIATSAVTGAGLDELRARIQDEMQLQREGAGVILGTAIRCRDSLRLAGEALTRAAELNASHSGEELVAAELRTALDELGKVVGAVYTDDILDRIFSRFCIGK